MLKTFGSFLLLAVCSCGEDVPIRLMSCSPALLETPANERDDMMRLMVAAEFRKFDKYMMWRSGYRWNGECP